MSYQSGEEAIGNAASSVSVTFAPAFGVEPDIVIAVVQNTVDNPQLAIKAQVTAKSATGFTADLDTTTDSANYELSWIAGDASLVFQSVSKLGTMITDLPRPARSPRGNDLMAAVQDGATVGLPFSHLQAAFIPTGVVPSASTDAGTVRDLATSGGYVYVHDGARWLRLVTVGHPTDWTLDPADSVRPAQFGTHSFSDTDTEAVVTFPSAFPSDGPAPHILWSIVNTTDVTPVAPAGVISAVSLSGFTLDLDVAVDSDNYTLNWYAVQS